MKGDEGGGEMEIVRRHFFVTRTGGAKRRSSRRLSAASRAEPRPPRPRGQSQGSVSSPVTSLAANHQPSLSRVH